MNGTGKPRSHAATQPQGAADAGSRVDPPSPSSFPPEDTENLGRLAITRKVGQGVQIGQVFVRICGLERGKVRLSITAPRDVAIVRDDAQNTSADRAAGAHS